MIISYSFITNSSSSSYLLEFLNEENYKKMLDYINNLPHKLSKGIKLFEAFVNKGQLIEYTQQKECDWISRIMGPCEYVTLNYDEYQIVKTAIEEAKPPKMIGYLDLLWGRQFDLIKIYCGKNSIKMTYLQDN